MAVPKRRMSRSNTRSRRANWKAAAPVLATCENPASLGAAHVSLEHKLALLTISYSGNDTCWEPSNAPHVVAW